MSNKLSTREEWLNALTESFRPAFDNIDNPLPENIRVSCGFPSRSALSRSRKRIGEAWAPSCSSDKYHETFISPVLEDPVEVGAVLVHELVHHAVGVDKKHGKEFRKCALAIGLTGKMTATVPTDALKERIKEHIGDIGNYPHGGLSGQSPIKKQSTRLLKVECECGCVIRMTQKWLDEVGPPTCGCGKLMMVGEKVEKISDP
jgi:hypothetical protein